VTLSDGCMGLDRTSRSASGVESGGVCLHGFWCRNSCGAWPSLEWSVLGGGKGERGPEGRWSFSTHRVESPFWYELWASLPSGQRKADGGEGFPSVSGWWGVRTVQLEPTTGDAQQAVEIGTTTPASRGGRELGEHECWPLTGRGSAVGRRMSSASVPGAGECAASHRCWTSCVRGNWRCGK
jgi:hypothetical protein